MDDEESSLERKIITKKPPVEQKINPYLQETKVLQFDEIRLEFLKGSSEIIINGREIPRKEIHTVRNSVRDFLDKIDFCLEETK